MPSVLQPWVQDLTIMQQSTLLGAIRGPDGIRKYHPVKNIVRWYRRTLLISAFDGTVLTDPIDPRGGSFTGPSIKTDIVADDLFPEGEIRSLYHEMKSARLAELVEIWEKHMETAVNAFVETVDELPTHYLDRLRQGCEIIGYNHPDNRIRAWWFQFYVLQVDNMHLNIETELAMRRRLGDNRQNWMDRNHPATHK